VLDCAIAAILYERFPQASEGELSRVRASLVNADSLATLALRLGVGDAVRSGLGQQKSGGGAQPSIAADALEALFGAIFLDGGFNAAREVIETVYAPVLADLDPGRLSKDPKTRLQEWLQARKITVPEYVISGVAGDSPTQTFTVECRIPTLSIAAVGAGPSRRAAEQAAAAAAYAEATTLPETARRD